jgi:hypothetical protein
MPDATPTRRNILVFVRYAAIGVMLPGLALTLENKDASHSLAHIDKSKTLFLEIARL